METERYHLTELDETGKAWESQVLPLLEGAPGKRALDVGTGSGFLAVLLARRGWTVTALDNGDWAVHEVKGVAEHYGVDLRICQADAADTGLPDGSFDVVICRYSSFLFPEPEAACREWQRLLVPGGILLNFDMNWMAPAFDEDLGRKFQQDEQELVEKYGPVRDLYTVPAVLDQMKALPLANIARPQWDLDCLTRLGFSHVEARHHRGLWNARASIRYRHLPTFSVRAVR